MPDAYARAGVNIKLGDDASKVLYEAAKLTWENRKGKLGEVLVPFDDFSGLRVIDVSQLPQGTVMNIGFDGVGTKMEIAERLNNHRTIAYDLFAMVCDDAVVRGAEPVLVGSILDVKSLGTKEHPYLDQIKQLAEGYIGAAKAAHVAVVNGEVAELGSRVNGYGPFNYNWGAAVVWFAKKERLFTGYEIQDGDVLVGLKEDGFRSNGLSLVRRILSKVYGENWHEATFHDQNIAELALTPSRIYSAAVVDMFGGYEGEPKAEIHGVAHITGGGLPGKLGRALKPSGLGAYVCDPFTPPPFMLYCQELTSHFDEVDFVSDEKAYKTWNMRHGIVIITPEPDAVIEVAGLHSIEAKVVGEVTAAPGIRIKSGGYYSEGKELVF